MRVSPTLHKTNSSAMMNLSPQEDSYENLTKVREKIPTRLWLVCWVTFFDRAAWFGTVVLFQNFLQYPQNDNLPVPGALGLGQSRSSAVNFAIISITYVTPLLGGYLADYWFGRFRTLQIGFCVYILGYVGLAATAFGVEKHGLRGPASFVVSAILITLGLGIVKPNLSAFLFDQLVKQESRVLELKDGKKVVTDYDTTLRFIATTSYWMINVGSLLSIVTTIVEKETHSFGISFSITLTSMVLAAILFQLGSPSYVKTKNRKQKFAESLARNNNGEENGKNDEKNIVLYESSAEDLKIAARAFWVFTPFPALTLCLQQMGKFLTAQAGQMETHGLPNDIMFNLNPICVMILLPIIQGVLYSFLDKRGIEFKPTSRIVVGLTCALLGAAYETGLQALIYSKGPCYNMPLHCDASDSPNHINVALQVPTYVFYALAEILAYVAGIELAYTQAPENLRSVVQALFTLFGAVGTLTGLGISFAAFDPHMIIIYGAMTGFLGLSMLVFIGLLAIKR